MFKQILKSTGTLIKELTNAIIPIAQTVGCLSRSSLNVAKVVEDATMSFQQQEQILNEIKLSALKELKEKTITIEEYSTEMQSLAKQRAMLEQAYDVEV